MPNELTFFLSGDEREVVSEAPEVRKRQTTAQSSTLAYGYLNLQARVADSTSARAAEGCGAAATMSTTSLFERTSQICQCRIQLSTEHNKPSVQNRIKIN